MAHPKIAADFPARPGIGPPVDVRISVELTPHIVSAVLPTAVLDGVPQGSRGCFHEPVGGGPGWRRAVAVLLLDPDVGHTGNRVEGAVHAERRVVCGPPRGVDPAKVSVAVGAGPENPLIGYWGNP